MGRTEPSVGKPPASFRRDARAKRAKATANKVIPAMLAAHPRARRGVENSELIVDPPSYVRIPALQKRAKRGRGNNGRGGCENGNEKGEGDEGNAESVDKHKNESNTRKGPRISLRIADTLSTAYWLLLTSTSSESQEMQEQRRDLSNSTARVGVLNMASPLAAGGGFLNGAAGQEEASLCARTTLLPSLRDEFYRLPEVGGVFTPDVLVFRNVDTGTRSHGRNKGKGKDKVEAEREENEREGNKGDGGGGNDEDSELLPKRERWFVDVVTAAMLRLPEIEVDAESGWASYASAQDRELAIRKMCGIMRIFVSRGVKRVVLGAWGCGAYGNPVGEIARAWRKVLLSGVGANEGNGGRENRGKARKGSKEKTVESWDSVEHVVFAIKDAGMARAFATAFGEDLLDKYDDEDGNNSSDEESDVEDEKVKELRDKIQELELQVEQARTPQLRSGLNSVLAGLRNQLPDYSQQRLIDDDNRDNVDGESGSEDDGSQSVADESD
ncbi:hypothetical protein F4805DRAFT_28198 [Annulohypoxylon moriforme]|nr:hypothetical protein F4805DRAFT_28198 [Annulohypoxylon moriforme]